MVVDNLKVLFATSFTFYLKTHGYHWNVTGENFYANHVFLEKIYTDVYGYIDEFAEIIRTTGEYAPFVLTRLEEFSVIKSDPVVRPFKEIVNTLATDNHEIINQITSVLDELEIERPDIANFLQDLLAKHYKINWMLESNH